MKRRRFIQAALLAGPAVTSSAAAGRMYGIPGSVTPGGQRDADRFLLPLSKSGLPPQFWNSVSTISATIANVLQSSSERTAFASSPAMYLASHGFDSSDATLKDETVRLMTVLSDNGVQQALAAKDYPGLMKRLQSSGVLNAFDSSMLQRRLESALSTNAREIRRILREQLPPSQEGDRRMLLELLGASGGSASEDDLAIAHSLLSSSMEGSSTLAMVVVTVALVLVTAAAYVVLWVAVGGWVYVSGPSGNALGQIGKLAQSDPLLLQNYERITRIAHMTGEIQLVQHGTKELILAETSALVNAMCSARIVNIPQDKRGQIIEAMAAYGCKTLGISP